MLNSVKSWSWASSAVLSAASDSNLSTARNRVDYFVRHFPADSDRYCPLSQLFPSSNFSELSLHN